MTLQPDLTPSNNLEHIVRSNVEIPHAEQWTMKSRTGHHDYQIMVYKPVEPPPPSGYPVIYLLDANSVFGTMVEAVRVQGRRPEKTGAIPAMIVGIGYPIAAPFSPHRYYDFTPKATTKYTRKPDGTPIPEQGGADEFLRFIEEELKPDMEQQFQIDRGRQAIFGHSLGGLFVIHALFTKPGLFDTTLRAVLRCTGIRRSCRRRNRNSLQGWGSIRYASVCGLVWANTRRNIRPVTMTRHRVLRNACLH